jgi:protein PET100
VNLDSRRLAFERWGNARGDRNLLSPNHLPSIAEQILDLTTSLHQQRPVPRRTPTSRNPQNGGPKSRSLQGALYPLPAAFPTNASQFGMYILFPISIMYYFGTNLDGKFTVPDFWPKPGQTHKIPYDREDIARELERLKARNLEVKRRREEEERRMREMGVGKEE